MTNNNPFAGNSKATVIYNQHLKMAAMFIGENATQEQKEEFAKEATEKWLVNCKKALRHSIRH